MCSRIVTPEELCEVKMLQMSMNTLHGSHAAQKLFIWLVAAGARVNICLPTHFLLCDDKHINWTSLKDTDGDVFIFFFKSNCTHEYLNI